MKADASAASTAPIRPAVSSPLRSRNYRALWIGETVSVLGTQFHLVALPWLVLQMTGSGFALGTVLMAAGIPRALLMLIGGGMADRLSPRTTMLFSNLARALIVGVLAALVWTGAVRTQHLLILAVLFGAADAFFYPAYMSIIPQVVPGEQRGRANSLLQSSAQLMVLIGPALAGALIAAAGAAQAFAIDSLSFLFAFLVLLLISAPSAAGAAGRAGLMSSVAEGLRYTWGNGFIRGSVFVTAMTNLAFIGPFAVGTALLAHQKFGSATSLGFMLSASGAGALLGATLAGVWQPARRRGAVILAFPAVLGVALIAIVAAPDLITASTVRGLAGITIGFMNVFATTLLQNRIEPAMMGRVMGVVTLSMFGLQPLSYLLAGALAQLGPSAVFLSASGLLFVGSLLASLIPEMRRFQ